MGSCSRTLHWLKKFQIGHFGRALLKQGPSNQRLPLSTIFLKARPNLVPSESLAFWRYRVTMWGHDAKIGKHGCFG